MTINIHRRTPAIAVADSRGLVLRQIAYLRTLAGEPATPLVTRQQYDAAGHQIAQWDSRLARPAVTSIYGLGGLPLRVDSVDAGWRLSLPGPAGQTLQRWDARGVHWRNSYDELLRVVSISNSAEVVTEAFTYADASADADLNLCGQLLERLESSGTLQLHSYGLLGQPLRETRTFTDAKAFVSQRTFSPLGAVLEQTDAGGHRQQSRYDLAGQLNHLQLQIVGHADWQVVLLGAQFNAAGQVIEQQAGNRVVSHWRYDPATGRLHRQWAQKNTEQPLQDFEYEYDPVGNVTQILDHVFTPSHFANQRVDGHRQFSYDSLYRLHSASGYDDAPPSDIPGRPLPTDPGDRRNYLQTYTYDHGGNLLLLRHVRDGATHTRQMHIDADSNRGVRWTGGDPPPDFETLFDRHGNLNAVQAGQAMLWNARDQLASVTLVQRTIGLDDAEYYHYSEGDRIQKRHETHTATTHHFHDVRYLPNLEIRTRDNGEELHVISLVTDLGHVSCLHWASEKPFGIATDQLRYTLDDHLGSCSMELDGLARLISHEGYYAFGATAWMIASSAIEVDYKTRRYSGKEMDVSGLYYYGTRYYAPWLQRWVSADPAGDVDGLNLYGFVGNNPIVHIDIEGNAKTSFLDGLAGIFSKTAAAGNTAHNLATRFDGPDDSGISPETRKDTGFFRFLFTTNGMSAFGLGAGFGGGLGAALGTLLGPVGNAIGGVVGALAGGLLIAYVRYQFFKKDIRIAQALNTEAIRDTTRDLAEGATDIAAGRLPQALQTKLDDIKQKAVSSLMEKLAPLDQLDVLDQVERGADFLETLRAKIEAVSTLVNEPAKIIETFNQQMTTAGESALGQVEQQDLEITSETSIRPVAKPRSAPIPKPRLNLTKRMRSFESYA